MGWDSRLLSEECFVVFSCSLLCLFIKSPLFYFSFFFRSFFFFFVSNKWTVFIHSIWFVCICSWNTESPVLFYTETKGEQQSNSVLVQRTWCSWYRWLWKFYFRLALVWPSPSFVVFVSQWQCSWPSKSGLDQSHKKPVCAFQCSFRKHAKQGLSDQKGISDLNRNTGAVAPRAGLGYTSMQKLQGRQKSPVAKYLHGSQMWTFWVR